MRSNRTSNAVDRLANLIGSVRRSSHLRSRSQSSSEFVCPRVSHVSFYIEYGSVSIKHSSMTTKDPIGAMLPAQSRI